MSTVLIALWLLLGAGNLHALVQPTQTFSEGVGLVPPTAQKFPGLDTILNAPARAYPIYGMYTFASEYLTFRNSAKQLGIKHVRINGGLDDAGMRALTEDGCHIIYCAMGSGRENFASDDAFVSAYCSGIETTLRRYGPGGTFFSDNPAVPNRPVQCVEIWNEPNIEFLLPNGTVAQRQALYAKMLTNAYRRIKAGWPTVRVAGFGTSGSSAADLGFIANVHAADTGVAHSYDLVTTHPYNCPAPAEGMYNATALGPNLATIRGTLRQYGNNPPVGYTEIGWTVSQAEGSYSLPSSNVPVTAQFQAAYVVRTYALGMRLGLESIDIMYIVDIPDFNAGFFKRSGEWRPAAYAAKAMTSLMPNPKLIGVISDQTSSLYAYTFIADANAAPPETVVMAWHLIRATKVNMTLTRSQGTVTDMLGVDSTLTSSGQITVGPCPIYLRGATITPATSVQDQGIITGPEAWAVRITPDPVQSDLILTFALREPGRGTFSITPVSGATIRTVPLGYLRAGAHTVNVSRELGTVPAGLYVYSLESGKVKTSGKIIKSR